MVRSLLKLLRALHRILSLFKRECVMFTKSVKEIWRFLVESLIIRITRKYHCLQIRKRMYQVQNYREWEQYAKLLDYLEGYVEFKYRPESEDYDYVRIDVRRVMMKQLRNSNNIKYRLVMIPCIRGIKTKQKCSILKGGQLSYISSWHPDSWAQHQCNVFTRPR